MVYLLYGDDNYRSWQKLQHIKAKYLTASTGDSDLLILDGATLAAADFERQTEAVPFMAASRLIIIKNLLKEGKKEVGEAVADSLSKLPKTTVLFFYEVGLPDKRTKLFRRLNQPKQAQEFLLLQGSELLRFVQGLAVEQGLTLTRPLLERFVVLVGADLWRATSELAKLALYEKAPSLAELESLVTDGRTLNVFALTDAFGNRQGKEAAQLLSRVDTDSSLGLLALVASHYRNLLLLADGQARHEARSTLAARLNLHPFVFQKCATQSSRYGYHELVACYRYLYELDLAAKHSLVEPLTGLAVLASALTRQPLKLPEVL